jgi:hypothetical protein
VKEYEGLAIDSYIPIHAGKGSIRIYVGGPLGKCPVHKAAALIVILTSEPNRREVIESLNVTRIELNRLRIRELSVIQEVQPLLYEP